MLSAEKRCRKGKAGYALSLKLVTAARKVHYWKTRKSDLLNKRDHDHYLIQLGIDLGIQYQDLTVAVICSNLTKSRSLLKTAQQQAAQLQDEYLEAWDTPFAHGPLKDYIGDYGIGSGAQDIPDGNFDLNVATSLPAVNYWLRHHVWTMAPPNLI
eukprot:9779966-Ditylum_brightwellii.AAC.2